MIAVEGSVLQELDLIPNYAYGRHRKYDDRHRRLQTSIARSTLLNSMAGKETHNEVHITENWRQTVK